MVVCEDTLTTFGLPSLVVPGVSPELEMVHKHGSHVLSKVVYDDGTLTVVRVPPFVSSL